MSVWRVDLLPMRGFVGELAAMSGEYIRPFFGDRKLAVDVKSDSTPVTQADRGAEELMRRAIKRRFPGHGIIGEEFGPENANAEFTWVLDPIDGTKSFISGVPLWGTLIALLRNGQPVLGCIHQPVLGQLLVGDGSVATLNGETVRTRPSPNLVEATLLTSCPVNLNRRLGPERADRLLSGVKLSRTWGDCYGYLLVATGRADVMCDPVMNLWDIAALVPIIRGAGGVITDWTGGPAFPAESTVAAGSPALHAELLAAIA